MYIEISANDVQTSDAIYAHVEKCVTKAMRNFGERVTRVEVHLKDINAKKGGVDKRCLLEARLAGQNPITAEHESDDLYLAISGAAEKLENAVRHRLGRLDARTS